MKELINICTKKLQEGPLGLVTCAREDQNLPEHPFLLLRTGKPMFSVSSLQTGVMPTADNIYKHHYGRRILKKQENVGIFLKNTQHQYTFTIDALA